MLSFALATQTCYGEIVGREEEGLAAECRDFWHLRMHGSRCEIVVNTLDRYSHLKNIKSDPCWHFEMLSLGFRGNAAEQLTLHKAIIFTAEGQSRVSLHLVRILKKSRSLTTVMPWAGSASATQAL